MRLFSLFLTILLFSGSSFAECRNKDCMTAKFELETMGHTFHYDEVFNIGTNWYIIFDYPENNTNKTITFEFYNGISKVHEYDNDLVTDSISFSGSAFKEEKLNLVLRIIFKIYIAIMMTLVFLLITLEVLISISFIMQMEFQVMTC